MSFLHNDVQYFDDSCRQHMPASALAFLRQLQGLTVFDCKGIDQDKTRVVATLIHGNEPSGFIGCHAWLKSNSVPATNLRIIFCNPEAANKTPVFTQRYLSGAKDLNRFFSAPATDTSMLAARARAISKLIAEVKPEAVLDLHNTSGSSPAFGVAVCINQHILDLVSLFANKLIYTGLNVGALMEQDFNAPTVTIECGGANQMLSHKVATEGLQQFFGKASLFNGASSPVEAFTSPIRIEPKGNISVNFSDSKLPTTDITLRSDIEKLNHQSTPQGEFLGWYNGEQPLPLRAIDEHGVDRINDIIACKGSELFTKQKLQVFMATTICEIATNDCLFYVTPNA